MGGAGKWGVSGKMKRADVGYGWSVFSPVISAGYGGEVVCVGWRLIRGSPAGLLVGSLNGLSDGDTPTSCMNAPPETSTWRHLVQSLHLEEEKENKEFRCK